MYLVVGFRFSRFVLGDEAVHAAVGTLPVVTSAVEQMRFAQCCTHRLILDINKENLFD